MLTVRQPWALALVLGVKPVENRSWVTPHRGELFIHAGKTWERPEVIAAVLDLLRDAGHQIPSEQPDELAEWHPAGASGALVGRVNLTHICSDGLDATRAVFMPSSCSDWAEAGQHHWQMRDARTFSEAIPMRGYQQVWTTAIPSELDRIVGPAPVLTP